MDLVAHARSKSAPKSAAARSTRSTGLSEFINKVRLAWRIFFPEQPEALTPKQEGKNRLRMILVADRCVRGAGLVAESDRIGRAAACMPSSHTRFQMAAVLPAFPAQHELRFYHLFVWILWAPGAGICSQHQERRQAA
jgi:hypothetical protein